MVAQVCETGRVDTIVEGVESRRYTRTRLLLPVSRSYGLVVRAGSLRQCWQRKEGRKTEVRGYSDGIQTNFASQERARKSEGRREMGGLDDTTELARMEGENAISENSSRRGQTHPSHTNLETFSSLFISFSSDVFIQAIFFFQTGFSVLCSVFV